MFMSIHLVLTFTDVQRAEEESSRALSLQKELEDLKETRQREKARETRRIQEDEEELQILRDRCEKLEEERENFQNSGVCLCHLALVLFSHASI